MELLHGDCRVMLKQLDDASVDSIVTDPPYELGFMGKSWDSTGVAYDVGLWRECLRVLKPGGHLLAFGGSRTYHRLACAVEDAGFEIRDQIMWVYGSGFPKSHNVSKAIDKAAGAEREVLSSRVKKAGDITGGNFKREGSYADKLLDTTAPATAEAQQWDGWGTALKPAHEPIVMARKPLDGTVANNVLKHGVGGINIDASRVGRAEGDNSVAGNRTATFGTQEVLSGGDGSGGWSQNEQGRFPANFIHDGSDKVADLLGDFSRFFYCAKPGKKERNAGLEALDEQWKPAAEFRPNHMDKALDGESGNPFGRFQPTKNFHPTVKPIALMRYLVRLVTPPGGIVLDPFAGSGSTLVAATMEKFDCIGIEMTDEYLPIIEARVAYAITDTLF
jgi:DNA modification methylase